MKIIPNTDERYAITEEGRVWRVLGTLNHKGQEPPHLVNCFDNGGGYRHLSLCGTSYYVHRLVAQVYLPNPDNHTHIGHRDHDKGNNCVDNLYWTDAATNTKHGIRDGKINYKGRIKGKMATHSDQVLCSAYVTVKMGGKVNETAMEHGINRTTLSSWINKRSRQELTDMLDLTLINTNRS